MNTRPPSSRRAVALIVTLIMLSVVTFLAIAFLAISRRERTSVIVQGEAHDAYHMAVTGYNRALAEVISKILATGDKANYGLTVSTNFINPAQGSPIPVNNYTAVNYNAILTVNDQLANLGNLLYSPRAPVYVVTNFSNLSNEFRFFVNFNRNVYPSTAPPLWPLAWRGAPRFETNGFLPDLNDVNTTNGLGTFSFKVGDPEWIGLLLYPGVPHHPTNPFVGRFAFLVLPASKCLDLNFIHNKAARLLPVIGLNSYRRNQGVGSWEINLAGFFADLNTNMWRVAAPAYTYDPLSPVASGTAFEDAGRLLNFRLNSSWGNLNSPFGMYGAVGSSFTLTSGFDVFGDGGPFMTNQSSSPNNEPAGKDTQNGWSGADNTNTAANSFLDIQEIFNTGRPSYLPVANLFLQYGTSNSTRDRYTFYTMLEQLGVDSGVPSGKVNINRTNSLTGAPETATGFQDWNPTNFFLIAAHQMIRASLVTQYVTVPVPGTNYYFGTNLLSTNLPPVLSSTNIAIWPWSEYSPEVHRLLQVAVNIYDSTTNNTQGAANSYPFLPTVLRPMFDSMVVGGVTNIHIAGWVEERGTNWLSYTNLDLSNSNHVDAILTNGTYSGGTLSFRNQSLVNGQPVLFGAKKGFPNFNEFNFQAVVVATRKLEMVKSNATDRFPWQTNQMLILGVSNRFGVECWNSYASAYPRRLALMVTNTFTYVLTNEFGLVLSNSVVVSSNKTIAAGAWSGTTNYSFQLPLFNTSILLTNSAYSTSYPSAFPAANLGGFRLVTSNSFDRANGFQVPQFGLLVTNHLRYALVDIHDANPALWRVVDYVNLTNLNGYVDIMRALGVTTGPWDTVTVYQPGDVVITNGFYYTSIRPSTNIPPVGSIFSVSHWQVQTRPGTNINAGSFWNNYRGGAASTNTAAPTVGITNQINVALNTNLATVANWRQWSSDTPIIREIQRFQYYMNTTATNFGSITNRLGPLQARMQCPFSPTRKVVQNLSWEVNDPFVHYTTRDITPFSRTNLAREINYIVPPFASVLPPMSFGLTNTTYRPWGGNPQSTVQEGTEFALWLKDPGVRRSDDWDFPSAKFPNIGWLGRVHRGTPWQTIYMKSTMVNLTNWSQWARSAETHPTNDWKLFDLFSAWPNNNAARGLLSINQTNLAAWSAVLDGVIALSNNVSAATGPFTTPSSTALMIEPHSRASLNGETNLFYIYHGIQQRRTAMTNFTRLGDILSVPELTTISPYLRLFNGDTDRNFNSLTNLTTGRPLLINSLTYEQMHSLTDNIYERIPQQVLGLLTVEDSPRFVVYAWGQALRPADRSLVIAPGQFYGMCTNYQISAEYALRAVVRVENLPTLRLPPPGSGPRVIVESFRQLPNE